MPTTWINGQLIDDADATISIRDFGLLHGAGVFTTMRADAGVIFELESHLKRLRASADAFSIPLTFSDDQLSDAIADLLADNNLSDARLRLTLTRGVQTHDPINGPLVKPNVILTATALEPYSAELYAKGMTALAFDEFKLNPYDPQAGHKTLDYLSRFAALRTAQQRGANEALLFNVHNFLQSSAIANVFLVKDGTLITPPTNQELRDPGVRAATQYPKSNVLPGITRGAILAVADDVRVQLRSVTINDVLEADEVFLTNSVMRVMPVCRIERKPIGNEQPGTITQLLANRLQQRIGGDQ